MTLDHKIAKMNDMALSMVDSMNNADPKLTTEEQKEQFWAIADGLTGRYIIDTMNRKCSLNQALIPAEKLEDMVCRSVEFLRGLKKILN